MAVDLHHVPGRLRVRVPEVKGSIEKGRALESSLLRLKGISRVECRELTGSLVIHYNPSIVEFQKLGAALGGVPNFMPATTSSEYCRGAKITRVDVPRKVLGKVAQAVAWHLLEQAAERTLPLVLAAIL